MNQELSRRCNSSEKNSKNFIELLSSSIPIFRARSDYYKEHSSELQTKLEQVNRPCMTFVVSFWIVLSRKIAIFCCAHLQICMGRRPRCFWTICKNSLLQIRIPSKRTPNTCERCLYGKAQTMSILSCTVFKQSLVRMDN